MRRVSIWRSVAWVAAVVAAGLSTPSIVHATAPSGPTLTWSGPLRLDTDGNTAQLYAVDCPVVWQCTE